MSKKSFTNGLESLFSSPREERGLGTLERPKRKSRAGQARQEEPVTEEENDKGPKRAQHKNFASDLESLLEEVFNDSLQEALEHDPDSTREKHPPEPLNREASGIDALIRSTLETSEIEVQTGKSRRVTFFFDARKVERLKEIARQENVYMREVISRIVAEYLARFEQDRSGSRRNG